MSIFVSVGPPLGESLNELDLPVDLGSDNPWNLPDWENIEAYPKVEHTSDLQWRWEFLRRDRHYRNLWLQYQRNKALWDEVQEDGESIGQWVAKIFSMSYPMSPKSSFNIFVELGMFKAKPFGIWAGGISPEKFARDALSKGQVLLSVDPTMIRSRIWDEVYKDVKLLLLDPEPTIPEPDLRVSMEALSPQDRSAVLGAIEISEAGATSEGPRERSSRVEPAYYPALLQILDADTVVDRAVRSQWEDALDCLAPTKNGDVLDYSAARKRLGSALKIQAEFIHEFGKRH